MCLLCEEVGEEWKDSKRVFRLFFKKTRITANEKYFFFWVCQPNKNQTALNLSECDKHGAFTKTGFRYIPSPHETWSSNDN